MDIRIGVVDSPKEISLEIKEDLEELTKRIDEALSGKAGVLWFVDDKGKKVGVPGSKVAYVEIDPDSVPRSVGFRP